MLFAPPRPPAPRPLAATTARAASPAASRIRQRLAAGAGLRDLDAAMDHLMSHRARLGEALGRADAAELRLSQSALAAQTARSGAEDLDMVQAISDFQNRQTGYDAALKTYSIVQRMSLFDYLR